MNDKQDSAQTEETRTEQPAAATETKFSRRQLLTNIALGGGGIALLIAALFSDRWRGDDDAPGGLSFVIPKGAGAAVNYDTMKSAITLPTEITFQPGEKAEISVTNEDSVPLRAGPFVVLPGQTYTQRFPNPGRFDIACTVDPAESITVWVLDESGRVATA
jgi:plastocyanin